MGCGFQPRLRFSRLLTIPAFFPKVDEVSAERTCMSSIHSTTPELLLLRPLLPSGFFSCAPTASCHIPLSLEDPIVQWPRTPPFHGGNTGSNPVRVAKRFSLGKPSNEGSYE
jgi:hypothetical protein